MECLPSASRLPSSMSRIPQQQRGAALCSPTERPQAYTRTARQLQSSGALLRCQPVHQLSSPLAEPKASPPQADGSDIPEALAPNQVQLAMPRRRMEVTFTCNKCGGRSTRLVNPLAWKRGTVFVQCQQCEVWHKIQDAAGLIEEVSGPGASQPSKPLEIELDTSQDT